MITISSKRLRPAMSRLLAIVVTMLTVALALPAVAAPAHYFVISEAADGTLSVVSHQYVNLDAVPDALTPDALGSRQDSYLDVVVRDKSGNDVVFSSVASNSAWLRGEFHGSDDHIDGHHLPLAERHYVVRLAVEPGRVLQLRSRRMASTQALTGASQSIEIDLDTPSSALSTSSTVAPAALPAGSATGYLAQTGNPANRLDLLIVAEGYTAAQQAQFVLDATALANGMLGISPYSDFRQLINVQWLFVPSNQSGADKPTCAETPGSTVVVVDTAFDGTFCTSGIRRLVTVSSSKVLTAAANAPDWDKILVLVNDSEYGGSGGTLGVGTTHSAAVQIMQHEFGHSFTKLADEYETAYPGFPACSDLSAPGNCEVNVSNQTDRALLKWSGWVDAATAIPTTAALADALGAGLWQGARYLTTGMYRQCYNGIMRALGRPFCRVDGEAFVKKLYGPGWGVPSTGVSLIEPGAIPTGATVNATGGSILSFRALLAGSVAAGGLTATWLVDGSVIRVDSAVHGSVVRFNYTVPASGTHSVELRVTDSTPLTLARPQSSRIWTVQPGSNTLGVSIRGTGSGSVASNPVGITCGSTCTLAFASPTSVTLTATPAAGSVFVGWLGACIGTGVCTVTAGTATMVTATFAPTTLALRLDVDGNGAYRAATDGVLAVRYLLGHSSGALVAAAVGNAATRSTPTLVTQYLDTLAPLLDVDGNGVIEAQYDGVIVLRYLLGLRGNALTANALGPGATRLSASAVEAAILPMVP